MTADIPTTNRPTRYQVKLPYVTEHTREFNVFAENEEDAIRYARELFSMDQKENCKPQGEPKIKILNPGCHD